MEARRDKYRVVDSDSLLPLLVEPDMSRRISTTARGKILAKYMEGDMTTCRKLVEDLVRKPPNLNAPLIAPIYGSLFFGSLRGKHLELSIRRPGSQKHEGKELALTPVHGQNGAKGATYIQPLDLRTAKPEMDSLFWQEDDANPDVPPYHDVGLTSGEVQTMYKRFLMRLWRAAFPETQIYVKAARLEVQDRPSSENSAQQDTRPRRRETHARRREASS